MSHRINPNLVDFLYELSLKITIKMTFSGESFHFKHRHFAFGFRKSF